MFTPVRARRASGVVRGPDPRAPRPVGVTFKPKTNRRYCSRFRFCVEEGEGFDVVFQGAGSFEEDVLARSVRIAGGR